MSVKCQADLWGQSTPLGVNSLESLSAASCRAWVQVWDQGYVCNVQELVLEGGCRPGAARDVRGEGVTTEPKSSLWKGHKTDGSLGRDVLLTGSG